MLIHAAGESASELKVPEGTYAVALHVGSENELQAVADMLKTAQIPIIVVHEYDAPYKGQAMAIGVSPYHGEEARRLLSCLPLVR